MDEQLKNNLTSSKHWVRFLYMILFAFFLYIASFFMVILVVVQFVFALLTGAENTKLRVFGRELTLYIHQMLMFLTYNTDFKPFPFADWPGDSTTVIVPERDPIHEQAPAPAQVKPATTQTDTAPPTRHTTAADAEVESPYDVGAESTSDPVVEAPSDAEPTEVTAATSLIDVEPAADVDNQSPASPAIDPASQPGTPDAGELPEDITPEPAGNTGKTTRTRKKPE